MCWIEMNFRKKLILSVFWNVSVSSKPPVFVHSVPATYSLTSPSEVRCDNSTVKQHWIERMMLNCFTLNRKMGGGGTERKDWEKGGQICKERKWSRWRCSEVVCSEPKWTREEVERRGKSWEEKQALVPRYFRCFSPYLMLITPPSSCPSTLAPPLTLHSFFYSPAPFPLWPESTIVVRFCVFLSHDCVCQHVCVFSRQRVLDFVHAE